MFTSPKHTIIQSNSYQQNMQTLTCSTHNRQNCVVDLDLSLLICQKCALFDPNFKHHQFIDIESLPAHAIQLHQQYQQAIWSLNLVIDKDPSPQWKTLQNLARQALDAKVTEINLMYDGMIAEIEAERTQKITAIAEEISRLMRNSTEEVNQLVKASYLQLLRQNDSYQQFLKQEKYLQLSKELTNSAYKKTINAIEKDLSLIELDFKHKLNYADCSPVPELNLARRRTFVQEELLLANQSIKLYEQFKYDEFKQKKMCKTDRIPMKEIFKTEASPIPQTEKCSTIYSKELDISCSQIDFSPKTTKVVTQKSQIKNMNIKNTIKKVRLTGLSLNNREAVDALRRCTTGTFVASVDLSQNQLTSQFIVLLKRQKNHSKYLKNIIVKGLQIKNPASLKKEGVSIDLLKEDKIKVGSIVLQL